MTQFASVSMVVGCYHVIMKGSVSSSVKSVCPTMYAWAALGFLLFVAWFLSMFAFKTEVESRKPVTIRPVDAL
jgi:hypothetical protein